MEEKLARRSEVPVNETWDLSLIYKTQEEFDRDLKKARELANQMAGFKGKLDNADSIIKCLDLYFENDKLWGFLGNYVDLALSCDYTDSALQELSERIETIISEDRTKISFIETDIARADSAVLEEVKKKAPVYTNYVNDILAWKPHMLDSKTEEVLTALSPVTGAPYKVYNITKLADMQFENFNVGEKSYPLGYSLFEDDYEYDERTEVRRAAFTNFSKKLAQYKNVTGTAYATYVQRDKIMAGLRGFDNVFESLLFNQKVSVDMYNRQIDLITEKLAPHMRKYAKLLQKVHGLDKMTFADLKLPVDPGFSPKVTIEEAKDYAVKGLSILGQDYADMVKKAFDERWFDFAKNVGKSTGGFCASPYGLNSFILLSWNGRMSDVFTIVHELGHAGHFKACNNAQHIYDTNVSTYFVEAPSTMNELLLGHYLLKTSDDKRFRRWVLSNMVGNTYYHNFVTHLLEAAYQREVYRAVERGEGIQAETLSNIKRQVLEKFWGDAVEITEGAELTWMRQPHYYMGLYSYTYSAGLTVATEVCHRIETEGEKAVEDWKKVLKMGSTGTPLELSKAAGVDISTDAPLLHTIETIGSYIDEIIKLTDEI